MNTTETSLRVRFARAMGQNYDRASILPEIDANTVREAWKMLTPEEKLSVVARLGARLKIQSLVYFAVAALDEEPTTLAELICEVRNV